MRVVIILAMAENRVIGAAGKLPWHVSEDLKRFKRLTMGHPIIMGRKTWESIGRPLPGRENIVVTRNDAYKPEGAIVVPSLEAALSRARASQAVTAFVIGGAELFRAALPLADALELTLLHRQFEGDVRIPEFDMQAWREVAREEREQPSAPGEPPLRYAFVTYERVAAASNG